MTRSTPCPVVLRQARGKLPGLVVPSAIHGTFRRITEGIPLQQVSKCVFFSTLGSGEQHDCDKFFGASRRPIQAARFSSNEHHRIIDLDIGPQHRTMKPTIFIPNLIKEYSLGHTYN